MSDEDGLVRTDPSKVPVRTAEMKTLGQVWAWMPGRVPPRWEIRGTGARR